MTARYLAPAPSDVSTSAWDAACQAVRGYCRWHIAPEITQTLTLDGPGGSLLMLPSLYVTDVASVTNDGTPVTDPQWSEKGMIRGSWTSKFRGVVVTFTHGYEMCPDDVRNVLEHMARQNEELLASGAVQTHVAGPFTAQMSSAALAGAVGLSGQHRGVLDRYRLPPRP